MLISRFIIFVLYYFCAKKWFFQLKPLLRGKLLRLTALAVCQLFYSSKKVLFIIIAVCLLILFSCYYCYCFTLCRAISTLHEGRRCRRVNVIVFIYFDAIAINFISLWGFKVQCQNILLWSSRPLRSVLTSIFLWKKLVSIFSQYLFDLFRNAKLQKY